MTMTQMGGVCGVSGIRLHYSPLAPLDIHAEKALSGAQYEISSEPQVLTMSSSSNIFFSYEAKLGAESARRLSR